MNIYKLPKIELHSHLDGSVHPKTIFELAKKDNIILPTKSYESFKEYVQAPDNCDSLKTYLKRFTLPIQIMQSKENLMQIAFDYIMNLKSSNVKYVEVRFAPIHHVNKGLTLEEIIESVLIGLKKASKETNILSNLIICGMRHLPVEENLKVFKKASKFLGHGVVGVDLAGNEADFPPITHKKAFEYAYATGFNITVHAGETGNYKNIITAVNDLKATRIGHGVNAINNQKTLELLKEKNITLEVCPTSNIQTKAYETYGAHPFKALMDVGIPVTLNTDNMTVSNTTLNKEYNLMQKTFSLNESDMIQLYKNAINGSFLSKRKRALLLKELMN